MQKEINVYLYHAFSLCIILNQKNLVPWFYEHYIQLFSTVSYNKLDIDFMEKEYIYDHVLHQSRIQYDDLKRFSKRRTESLKISDFLIESLCADYYAVIYVDWFYLPRSPLYKKKHLIHEVLLRGYDKKAQCFIGLCFNEMFTFEEIEYGFKSINRAFQSTLEYFRTEQKDYIERLHFHYGLIRLITPRKLNGEYPFDIQRFLKKLKSFVYSEFDSSENYFSVNQDVKPKSWETKDVLKVMKFGYHIYEDVTHHLNNLITEGEPIEYPQMHILYEHKKGLLKRLSFVKKKLKYQNTFEVLLKDFEKIVQGFTDTRLLFFKYEHSLQEKQIHKIVDKINYLKKEERRILEECCLQIEKYYVD